MTPSRSAFVAAIVAYAAAAVIAIVAVPWDGDVAPWADLDLSTIDEFTADQVAMIQNYVAAAWLPGVLGLIAGPIVACLLLLVPGMRRRLAGLGRTHHRLLDDLIVATVVLVTVRLAALPFAVWSAQVRRDAGLLVEPWSAWWLRWLGEASAFVAIGAAALIAALAILRRWPLRGWIAVTAGAGLATLLITAVIPLVQRVEGAVADPSLTASVMDIADRAGVDVGRVSIIAVSDTTPAINANVSGWGATRTVTVYDTVGTTLSEAELDALIAHELVHVREGDAVLGAVLAVVSAVGTTALLSSLILSARVRRWLGATSPADPPVIPLAVAVVLVASLAATVAGANLSRSLESRADREAIAITGDAQAYRSLMTQLAVTNRSTLVPAQWRYALLFTHPTPLQRLAAVTE